MYIIIRMADEEVTKQLKDQIIDKIKEINETGEQSLVILDNMKTNLEILKQKFKN